MQRQWGFDDSTAHHLALIAMEQYGLMLAGLQRDLHPTTDRSRMLQMLGDGLVPVWMPTKMALGREDIPESWDVTADSLAAWLAAEISADCLILVKSVAVEAECAIEDLVRREIVDPALPGFLARGRAECRCIEANDHEVMGEAIVSGVPPGTLVRRSVPGASIARTRRSANIRR
jgi:aspartokinase-like uncharacterized kinase